MVAVIRTLLQQDSVPQAAQDGNCQHLGSVSVGGWIVIGFLLGFCCGIASTILFQCYRRKKEEKYLAQAPVEPWPHAIEGLKQTLQIECDGRSLAEDQQSATYITALPAGRRCVQPPQKYYAPLTKSLSVGSGSLLMGLEGVRSSTRLLDMGGGDIGSKAASDQRPGFQTSLHGLPAVQNQSSYSGTAPGHQAARLSHAGRLHSASHHQHALMAHGSQLQMTRPLPVSSPDSSDPDYNLSYQQHLPTMPECLPSPSDNKVANNNPSESVSKPRSSSAAAHSAACNESAASTAAAHGQVQQSPRATTAATGSNKAQAESSLHEVDDAYEEEELDDDWKRLLGDVDDRLLAQNQRVMNARERSVAIKKLLVATGTRGVDFAMNAALEEVLQFRKFHGL